MAYDDGDSSERLAADRIRRAHPLTAGKARRSSTGVGPKFAVGDHVSARYAGGDVWWSGVIRHVVTSNGRRSTARGSTSCVYIYDIAYDDGDKESNVPESLIRAHSEHLKNNGDGGDDDRLTLGERLRRAYEQAGGDRQCAVVPLYTQGVLRAVATLLLRHPSFLSLH